MKKERKIIIKNSKLQTFRNNMRKIIAFAVEDEISRLRHQERLYCDNRDARRNTPSQKKRERYLLNKRYELSDALKRSICCCFSGNHCSHRTEDRVSKENMAFVRYMGAWFCVDCYEGIENTWKFYEQHRKAFVCELREAESLYNSRLIKKLSKEVLNGKLSPKEANILLSIGSILEKDRKWVKSLLLKDRKKK